MLLSIWEIFFTSSHQSTIDLTWPLVSLFVIAALSTWGQFCQSPRLILFASDYYFWIWKKNHIQNLSCWVLSNDNSNDNEDNDNNDNIDDNSDKNDDTMTTTVTTKVTATMTTTTKTTYLIDTYIWNSNISFRKYDSSFISLYYVRAHLRDLGHSSFPIVNWENLFSISHESLLRDFATQQPVFFMLQWWLSREGRCNDELKICIGLGTNFV